MKVPMLSLPRPRYVGEGAHGANQAVDTSHLSWLEGKAGKSGHKTRDGRRPQDQATPTLAYS